MMSGNVNTFNLHRPLGRAVTKFLMKLVAQVTFPPPIKHDFYDPLTYNIKKEMMSTGFVKAVFVQVLWDDFYHRPLCEKTRYVCAGRQFASAPCTLQVAEGKGFVKWK